MHSGFQGSSPVQLGLSVLVMVVSEAIAKLEVPRAPFRAASCGCLVGYCGAF